MIKYCDHHAYQGVIKPKSDCLECWIKWLGKEENQAKEISNKNLTSILKGIFLKISYLDYNKQSIAEIDDL